MRKTAVILAIAACSAGTAFAAAGDKAASTPAASNAWNLYQEKCSGCHSEDMTKAGMGPALKGSSFVERWQGKAGRDLYRRIISTMPFGSPGTLSREEVLALASLILQENGQGSHFDVTDPAGLDSVKITESGK